jgi:RDD family
MIKKHEENTDEPGYPFLSERVQSTFIDTILIIILGFLFAPMLDRFKGVPDWVRLALFVGLWAIYEPVCTSIGCTLGNYLKNIRVRQNGDSSKRINILRALLRYVIKIGLGWISFLTMHTNRERRAIHDFVAGSVMIRNPNKTVS